MGDRGLSAVLGRLGLVDRRKATEAFDLAAPVVVTGGLRVLLRVVDFLFVGIVFGDVAIAGLEIGFQYYFVGFGLSLALSSGTISVGSRLQGAGDRARAALAVKQSLWLLLLLSVPLTTVSWFYAEPFDAVRLGIGPPAVFLARLADYYVKAAVNTGRFWSGRWREVARRVRVGVGADRVIVGAAGDARLIRTRRN